MAEERKGIQGILKTLSNNICRISYGLILAWILIPFLIMFLHLLPVDSFFISGAWTSIELFIGNAGLVLGILFLYRKIKESGFSKKQTIIALIPLLILTVFLLWTLICCLCSNNIYITMYGDWYRNEGFITYISYAGFLSLGLIISQDKKKLIRLAQVFLVVAAVMSIISMTDTPFSQKLFVSYPFTGTPHYQGVFFNTNHFGYYLLMVILTGFFLYMYETDVKKKVCYVISFCLEINMLILNNTMGDYLALLILLIFVLIWKFINKEDDKKKVLFFLSLFIATSLLSFLYTSNVYDNFRNTFGDLELLNMFFVGRLEEEEISDIGSLRGELWTNGIHFIMQSPIIGYGLDNASYKYLSVGLTTFRPHNIFIQMGLFTGIPGLLLYVSTYVVGAVRMIKERKTISPIVKSAAFISVGYMMSAFFGNSMFYTSPYYLIIFGICASGCIKCILKNKQATKTGELER